MHTSIHPLKRLGTALAGLAVAATACLLALAGPPSTAMASIEPAPASHVSANLSTSAAGRSSGEEIVRRVGSGTVTVALPTGERKQAWQAKYAAPETAARSTAETVTSWGRSNGPGGAITATGSTRMSNGCGLLTCNGYFDDSHAAFAWLGSNPYNAQEIQGSMKWWLSGIDISVSLPAGVGFSKSGSGLIWQPGTVSNEWRVGLHYPARVQLNATYINNMYFTDQADFLIGNQWYHVQGN